MGFDYTGANPNPKCLPVTPSLIPLGTKDDPIFIADLCPRFIPTGLHDVATGLPIMAMQVCVDGAAVPPYPLGYFNDNGEFILSTGNNVSGVATVAKKQRIGTFGANFFANGADLTITNADLVAAAVAAGTLMNLSDGTSRAALVTDFIYRIDVDLVHPGDTVDVAGVVNTTTAASGSHNRGGGVYEMTGGDGSEVGEMRASDGFFVIADTGDILLRSGTGAVISFNLAELPA